MARNFSPKTYSDSWQWSGDLEHFASTSNFEENGSSASLNSGNGFGETQSYFKLRHPWSDHWAFSAELSAGYTESVTPTLSRQNSGLNNLVLSIDYNMIGGSFNILPELILIYPFQKVDPQTDTVLIGEGALSAEARLNWQKLWPTFKLLAHTGFKYRDEGRSSLFTYKLSNEFDLNSFLLGAGFEGFVSVLQDQHTKRTQERLDVVRRVDAGSYRYYSVNPTEHKALGWLGYQFDRSLSVRGGLDYIYAGGRVAAGYGYFVGIEYSFEPVKSSEDYNKSSVNEFEFDTQDNETQKYFESEPPSKPKSKKRIQRKK